MSSSPHLTPPTRDERRAAARDERQARERAAVATVARRRRLWILAGLAAIAAGVVAIAVVLGSPAEKSPAPPAATSAFAGIAQDGITLGSPAAPVTLVEYADVQCPFCAVYATTVLPTVVDRYVRTGKVKLQLRLLAFVGDDSVKAARAAAAVTQQDRLWQFSEQLFARQGAENSGWVTDALLRDSMRRVPGLDVERALAAADSTAATRLLDEAERSAGAAGVNSTPAFRVGRRDGASRRLEPAELTPQAFTTALDAALAAR